MSQARRSHLLGLLVAAMATAALPSPSAQAQFGGENSTSFQVEHFEPGANQGLNMLSVTTSRLLPHLMPSAGLVIHYAKDPLVLYQRDANGDERIADNGRLIEHQVIGELWLSLGVLDWLNFNLNVPATLYMSGAALDDFGKTGQSIDGAAMGDIRLSAKLRFVRPEWTGGFGMALVAEVWFPSGDTDTWRGDGDVRFAPKLVMDFRTDGGFGVAVNVAYQMRPERKTQNIISDDVFRWAVGIEIPTAKELQILLTGFGNVQLTSDVNPYDPTKTLNSNRNTPIDLVGAFQFRLPAELVLQVGGGLGLMRAAGSPEARALFSFGYTPDPTDTDKDGLRDAVDACPEQAEDVDKFQDDDGCPDPDNDGDGILDVDDKCPLVKEDIDQFEDEDGCPEGDNDKDGILDVNDKCPNDPEDMDGFEDTDGCPDPDNDGDGIPDAKDKCPNVAEDKDGFDDADGCPELDNDGDGLNDDVDKCPNVPETKNGYKDDDGCPDAKPQPKPKPTKVKVTNTKIEILEKVFFKTGKATIKSKSYGLLREVAQVMNAHPAITKIQVEGHTDSRGKSGYNRRLSQARAEAVRDFLIYEGVKSSRLVAKGWGEDRPIASNKRSKGRAKNRRVEFLIIEVNGKTVGPGPVMVPVKDKK